MRQLGNWQLALHGRASLGYFREESYKGGSRFGSPNWAMAMLSRAFERARLTFSFMGSAERLTMGECGMPRLLAAGPACADDGFGEYQHPHAPVMEAGARLSYLLNSSVSVELYAAAAGEPALGPVHYLHRVSAAADPVAPMTFHEANPAHASPGVLTAGIAGRVWKLEASAFDGQPTNPDRVLPEVGPLNSYALRATLSPSSSWSVQVSGGRIPTAADHHTGAAGALRTFTASIAHSRQTASGRALHATAVAMVLDDDNATRRGAMLEGTLELSALTAVFARAEAADRFYTTFTPVENPDGSHGHTIDVTRYGTGQLTLGYLQQWEVRTFRFGLGFRGSLSFIPREMKTLYGRDQAMGAAIFLDARPFTRAATTHAH